MPQPEAMTLADAQQESRTVYLSGSVGQIVSGVIWLISASLSTWVSHRGRDEALIFGGMFIFPPLRFCCGPWAGRHHSVGPTPLGFLAMQVAFFVPLCIPVVLAASLAKPGWFYPGLMIVVGAHYLPFIFLYGLARFGFLAAILLAGGMGLGLRLATNFVAGGWSKGRC